MLRSKCSRILQRALSPGIISGSETQRHSEPLGAGTAVPRTPRHPRPLAPIAAPLSGGSRAPSSLFAFVLLTLSWRHFKRQRLGKPIQPSLCAKENSSKTASLGSDATKHENRDEIRMDAKGTNNNFFKSLCAVTFKASYMLSNCS